jgi:low affinity Fe/Cu permease
MSQAKRHPIAHWFERFSVAATLWTGSTWAFIIAIGFVVIWSLTGPYYHYSDTWQLIINTATTIITFLMVFLIQRSQNKDSEAIQLKLNEILAAHEGASNRLINVEDLSEEEVRRLHRRYRKLARQARRNGDILSAHTIEEAECRKQVATQQAEAVKREGQTARHAAEETGGRA